MWKVRNLEKGIKVERSVGEEREMEKIVMGRNMNLGEKEKYLDVEA